MASVTFNDLNNVLRQLTPSGATETYKASPAGGYDVEVTRDFDFDKDGETDLFYKLSGNTVAGKWQHWAMAPTIANPETMDASNVDPTDLPGGGVSPVLARIMGQAKKEWQRTKLGSVVLQWQVDPFAPESQRPTKEQKAFAAELEKFTNADHHPYCFFVGGVAVHFTEDKAGRKVAGVIGNLCGKYAVADIAKGAIGDALARATGFTVNVEFVDYRSTRR